MKNTTAITLVLITFFITTFGGITATKIIEGLSKNNRINSYNAGYRAGKLEGLAELVECNHVTDKYVLAKYEQMTEILREQKELDTAPFPCKE